MQALKKKIKKLVVYLRYPALFSLPHGARGDEVHLEAAMQWLVNAQDASGGVRANYDLWKNVWGLEYRETTGYIIETFLAYYHHTNNKEFLDRAKRMGDWEISVQCDDGAVGEIKKDGSIGKKIFNTGQVMIGFNALYKETGEEKYLNASKKAAEWLAANQEPDGSWQKFTSLGSAQTIETRVAWPLVELGLTTNDERYIQAAKKNLEWTMSQQNEVGWFANTSFTAGVDPWTHQIAYTISGLLECYKLLDIKDKKLFDAFYKPSKKLLEIFEQKGTMPASFGPQWEYDDSYTCLTGNAQLAIVWFEIFKLTGEENFKKAAEGIIEEVKKVQSLSGSKEIKGGLLGSYPIDGNYAPYTLPNWAVKFFTDALMFKK